MQLRGGEGRYGLKYYEKERNVGIKAGGINLCKKVEMMVFDFAKGIWYATSRKSNENVTQK